MTPEQLNVGRFDFKADSVEDLLVGRTAVIEINAAGGIPTHVYDTKRTIPEKYNILQDHFDTMVSIAQHHQQLHTPRYKTSKRAMWFSAYRSIAKKNLFSVETIRTWLLLAKVLIQGFLWK
jgi:Mg2+/Co2+ transporter CorB